MENLINSKSNKDSQSALSPNSSLLPLDFDDKGNPFLIKNKIQRTPIKGEFLKKKNKKTDKADKEKHPKRVTPPIAKTINELTKSLFDTPPPTKPSNPKFDPREENFRLARENLRLATMVDDLTKQLATQSQQLNNMTELMNNLTKQNDNFQLHIAALTSALTQDNMVISPAGAASAQKRKRGHDESDDTSQVVFPLPTTTDNALSNDKTSIPGYIPPSKVPKSRTSPNKDLVASLSHPHTSAQSSNNDQTNAKESLSLPSTSILIDTQPEKVREEFPPLPAAKSANTIPGYSPPSRPTPTLVQPQPSTSTLPPTNSTSAKIPPIVLRDKARWVTVNKAFKHKGWSFNKATSTSDGIKFIPSSIADYRAMSSFLTTNNEEFHTFQLPEERQLQVVIRGLPLELDIAEIGDDLKNAGFQIQTIVRMKKGPNRTVMPLILLKLPRDQTSILDVESICSIRIKVETLRRSNAIGQCYRCQRYGHAQTKCTAAPKCMKCAGPHLSRECTKSPNTPAKCANCGGPHTSNAPICSKNPNQATSTTMPPNISPGTTFSQATAAPVAPSIWQNTTSHSPDLGSILVSITNTLKGLESRLASQETLLSGLSTKPAING